MCVGGGGGGGGVVTPEYTCVSITEFGKCVSLIFKTLYDVQRSIVILPPNQRVLNL